MKIRRAQMEVLADNAFAYRLLKQMRSRFERKVSHYSDAEILKWLREGLARGRRYGLTWESSLGTFAILTIVVGPDFDRHPRINQLLRDPTRSPDNRIDTLLKEIARQEWKEAADLGAREPL